MVRAAQGFVSAQRERQAGQGHRAQVATPSTARATCTAQSARASPYSRVPSTGSTIQTRAGAQASGVIALFFGQDSVVRAMNPQRLDDESVGDLVAGLAQDFAGRKAVSYRSIDQQPPGGLGNLAGQFGIVHTIS